YVDREQRYRFANDRFQTFFGITREEALGKSVAEVIGPDAMADAQRYIAMALDGHPVNYDRTEIYHGRERHLHVSYLPDMADDGTTVGFFAMVQDVSVTKRTELELQRL